ncbi:GNAS complex locus isoform 1 [Reticulomyxa filosa]|uniref:GNAS complex locus isoform 1 n=1 Tax=Reticulomyxa filosa TaxID=46433 RepID=X6NG55_RETFI|nr:GNAS complex locus isoform 1 [Reticulomyxa filosa]|eukprot:ETO24946.1 GNAS complex locus isoform 1 [Reticulomyxa filosa]
MGNLCANDDAETKTTRNIDRMLVGVERSEKKENKLLLLGTGSSGKSTLFKGLRLVNGNEFEQTEKVDTRRMIRSNIVASIMTLLQKSQVKIFFEIIF